MNRKHEREWHYNNKMMVKWEQQQQQQQWRQQQQNDSTTMAQQLTTGRWWGQGKKRPKRHQWCLLGCRYVSFFHFLFIFIWLTNFLGTNFSPQWHCCKHLLMGWIPGPDNNDHCVVIVFSSCAQRSLQSWVFPDAGATWWETAVPADLWLMNPRVAGMGMLKQLTSTPHRYTVVR